LILPIFIAAAFPTPTFAARGKHESPKLINFFLGYEIKPDDPAKLAQWDIVVLDMDQTFQFPDRVREIKRLNPNVQLLAYVSASEVSEARFRGHPSSPGAKLASRIPEAWFLARPDGSRIQWWAGNWIMNASDRSPSVGGKQWNDFLGEFIRDEIMSQGVWDGVFLDAAYGDVTPHSGTSVDIDRNGIDDTVSVINQSWRAGMTELIRKVRAANPDIWIINNSSSAYSHLTNGTLFEDFPRYGFASTFAELRTALTKNVSPKISAINTNTNNQERPNDYRLMRYGLTSALIADGYYSFDAGDAGHHRTWWYDEYDVPIGPPRGQPRIVKGASASQPAVWVREFARGYAVVNATSRVEEITLPGEFEKLSGTQDARTNNGSIVTKVAVPSEDGLVLIRRSDVAEVRGASFQNGSFLQVFDMEGRRLRNAFFANRDDVPGGANVLVDDVDRDNREDVIFSRGGLVTVRLGNGGRYAFRPFGSAYRGGIEIAVGQTDRTNAWELVFTPSAGREATVVVTDLRGRALRSWLSYRVEFKGGASVAIGDFNNDGLREIVTGPGNGGGPHIRTFKTDAA
ncbi:MAG: putative glycoside hydrolase, partial [Candidatus Uhrbacteria bacterium]|nr:putative glycoside hydrolase [Candidatus Uhrbacteria bacterium]